MNVPARTDPAVLATFIARVLAQSPRAHLVSGLILHRACITARLSKN